MVPSSQNPIWSLIVQSDLIGKLVLLSMLILSVCCWAILFYKLIMWRARHKELESSLDQLKSARNLEDVFSVAAKFVNSLPGYILTKQLSYVRELLLTESQTKSRLDDRDWELLQSRINQLIDSVMVKEESFLIVISISATVGPLLGLLGTVWGLIHAFLDISQHQSADITVVAPGIAEALITTMIGLVVAIPALIMYNFLNLKLRDLDLKITNLSSRFIWLVHKSIIGE